MVTIRTGNRETDSIARERIIIEGETRNRVRFEMPSFIEYNPYKETIEEAIIRSLGSRAGNFQELAVEKGWSKADWSFPPIVDFRERINIV